ncbi:hypothetical protein IWW37_003507 [Coemansia sp. RSA 2050]|nr:hypothetical protein IWW37_003507 [Coemansia sp. RSA 2050]
MDNPPNIGSYMEPTGYPEPADYPESIGYPDPLNHPGPLFHPGPADYTGPLDNPEWQRYAHYTTTSTIGRGQAGNQGQSSKTGRQPPRTKTPWTAEENRNLFRAMAEYIYVDKQGMKPLAIYLNPTELDNVESCESALNMTDDDIASSLLEQGIEVNPNRRGDLLFHVLRHMQRASGNQSTRVVNEKVKNVRSRIINLFMNMYNDGDLPSKRPIRYVSALLTSLVNSPFFPLDALDATTAASVYSLTDTRHDVSLWLQAMFWLHPKSMYEFISQCALQITRAQAERTPIAMRTAEEHNVLSETPEYRTIITLMHRLVVTLNGGGSVKKPKSGGDSRGSGTKRGPGDDFDDFNEDDTYDGCMLPRRRRRKGQTLDGKKMNSGNDIEVTMNDGVKVSLTLFDMLKTEEKLLLAGISIRMLAAVGGVIRNNRQATLDIKYHMYRMWTCISHLSDVSHLFQSNAASGDIEAVDMGLAFAEFVVVKYFTGPFEQNSIEPRIRVSKDRTPCPGGLASLEALIEQTFASTEEESREEISTWLVVAKRQDNKYVLALIVTSPEIGVPSENGVSLFFGRHYSDQMLGLVIGSAVATSGKAIMGTLPIQNHSGLDPWPWMPGQAQSISVEAGFIGHIPLASEYNETLIVATINYRGVDKASPWHEPRIMTEVIFDCQQSYANLGITGNAPPYEHLLQSGITGAMTAAASTVAALTRNHSPLLLPSEPTAFPILPDNMGILDQPAYYEQMPGNILASSFGQAYHHEMGLTAPNSAAILSRVPVNGNLPMASPSATNLLLSPQHYFSNEFMGQYQQNGWAPANFAPADPYPQFFEQFDGPDYPPLQ